MAAMPTRVKLHQELRTFTKLSAESVIVNITAILEADQVTMVNLAQTERLDYRQTKARPPCGEPDEKFHDFYPITIFPQSSTPVQAYALVSDILAIK